MSALAPGREGHAVEVPRERASHHLRPLHGVLKGEERERARKVGREVDRKPPGLPAPLPNERGCRSPRAPHAKAYHAPPPPALTHVFGQMPRTARHGDFVCTPMGCIEWPALAGLKRIVHPFGRRHASGGFYCPLCLTRSTP